MIKFRREWPYILATLVILLAVVIGAIFLR